jgi:DNA helicase-2/ATP-dependent DNA helicase PcrA
VNTARSNWEKSRGFPSIALPVQKYIGELDDERRLFYVAVTRAKEELCISSSRLDWYGKAMEPSQFISELGEAGVVYSETDSFEQNNETELIRFFSNEVIEHSVFSVEYLASRYAEENVSVTALNNYLDCPIKYLFRNLIQLPDVYTPALRYGDAVHRALESFFIQSAQGGTIGSRDELLAAYDTAISTAGFFGAELDTFRLKGRQSLGMYYDYYAHTWSSAVTVEEYVRRTLTVGDTNVTLSGKIDKLEWLKHSGAGPVRVVDYKTGKVYSQKSSRAQKDALERQIQFYHLLLQDYKGGDVMVAEAVLDFVEPTDDGEFEQKTLTVSEEDIFQLIDTIAKMAQAVCSGEFLQRGCKQKDCESCALYDAIVKNHTH